MMHEGETLGLVGVSIHATVLTSDFAMASDPAPPVTVLGLTSQRLAGRASSNFVLMLVQTLALEIER